MAPKAGATHVDLKQFAYRPRARAQRGQANGRSLSQMGEALAEKFSTPANQAGEGVTPRTTLSANPCPVRMPNIPRVPATGPQGVCIAKIY